MNTFKKIVVAACVAAAGFSTGANASLIGQTITATGANIGPSTATISSAVEFRALNNNLNFDFGANTLTLSPASFPFSFGNVSSYTFGGFTSLITGFSIASNDGFTGTLLSNFSFTSNSLTLDPTRGSATFPAALVFNIQTSSDATVPEPATTALLGLGLLGFAASRRKSAKSKNG